MPLLRLRRLGVYYSEYANCIPAVMMHFLKNVQALHKVNIMLSVRFFPIPVIDADLRFKVHVPGGVENLYQVRHWFPWGPQTPSFTTWLRTSRALIPEAQPGARPRRRQGP